LGLEPTLDLYIEHLLLITAELKRVLRPTGVLYWNHGDSYGGSSMGSWNAPIEIRGKQFRHCLSIDTEYLAPPRKDKSTKAKCLCLQNFRLLIRMIDEQGWILRNVNPWVKPNAMPSSVKDRFANKWEPVFMLVKNRKYWFDLDAIRVAHKESSNQRYKYQAIGNNVKYSNRHNVQGLNKFFEKQSFNYRVREAKKGHNGIIGVKAMEEEMGRYDKKGQTKIPEDQAENFGSPRARYHRTKGQTREIKDKEYKSRDPGRHIGMKGKNPGDVWIIPTQPFPEAHFATFPERLVQPLIKAGCPKSGIVLDPFAGSGTTLVVAKRLGRSYIGIEIKPAYVEMAKRRLAKTVYQKEFEFDS